MRFDEELARSDVFYDRTGRSHRRGGSKKKPPEWELRVPLMPKTRTKDWTKPPTRLPYRPTDEELKPTPLPNKGKQPEITLYSGEERRRTTTDSTEATPVKNYQTTVGGWSSTPAKKEAAQKKPPESELRIPPTPRTNETTAKSNGTATPTKKLADIAPPQTDIPAHERSNEEKPRSTQESDYFDDSDRSFTGGGRDFSDPAPKPPESELHVVPMPQTKAARSELFYATEKEISNWLRNHPNVDSAYKEQEIQFLIRDAWLSGLSPDEENELKEIFLSIKDPTKEYVPTNPDYSVENQERVSQDKNSNGKPLLPQGGEAVFPEVEAFNRATQEYNTALSAFNKARDRAMNAGKSDDEDESADAYGEYIAARNVLSLMYEKLQLASRRKTAAEALARAQYYGVPVRFDPTADLSEISVEKLESAAEEALKLTQGVLKQQQTTAEDRKKYAQSILAQNFANGFDLDDLYDWAGHSPERLAIIENYLMPDNQETEDIQRIMGIIDGDYKDNAIGQFSANLEFSKLSQERALAANTYLDNPTESNRKHVQRLGEAMQMETAVASAAMDDVFAVAPNVTKELAQYLPKLAGKEKTKLIYGATAATAGVFAGNPELALTLYKVGAAIGSSTYSYATTRGATYLSLLELGVNEDAARKAAGQEALINSIIDLSVSVADFAANGAIDAIKGERETSTLTAKVGKVVGYLVSTIGSDMATPTVLAILKSCFYQNGEAGQKAWESYENSLSQEPAAKDATEYEKRGRQFMARSAAPYRKIEVESLIAAAEKSQKPQAQLLATGAQRLLDQGETIADEMIGRLLEAIESKTS